MLESIEIHNWQSLRNVQLQLGRFTVIVGPSSCGKTALMRALRAVASNVRGSGNITRGAKATAITVRTGDKTVTLERSESSGRYLVVDQTGHEEVYVKLAGAVPEAVTAALRIDPVPTTGSSLNFAGQFDRPFLLGESGAAVARVLGELTNVTTIFEAVREANRLRASATAELRTREADLRDLVVSLGRHSELPEKLRTCETAEQTAEEVARLSDRAARLRRSAEALDVAESVLSRSSTLPDVPTADALDTIQARLGQLQTDVRAWLESRAAASAAASSAEQYQTVETELHGELHALLVAAGTCPTCGQTTTSKEPPAV
jgi:DNA repair ATPase RecN